MATKDLTLSHGQAANVLVVLYVVERLPILSASLMEDVNSGEAYETLFRRLHALHDNILEIAEIAVAAKTSKTKEAA